MLSRTLLKVWPVVMLAVLIGLVAGYFIVFGTSAKYKSTATLYVTPPTSSSPTDAVMGDTYAASRTQLYLELAKSDALAQRVAAQLQSSEPPSEIASRIDATGSHDAPLLIIDAEAPSQQEAHDLAVAYVDQFPEYAKTVEQGSGLREGPVLIAAAGPQDLGKTTGGFKSWLRVFAVAALAGLLALMGALWYRHLHPNSTNLRALRTAMPEALVEKVGADPGELPRIHALLFAAPNSVPSLLFAGARQRDDVEGFASAFAGSLTEAGIAHQHLTSADLDNLRRRQRTRGIEIVEGPALLDDSHRVPELSFVANTAVIVAKAKQTLVEDVAELGRILTLNGIDVKAVLVVGQVPRVNGSVGTKAESKTASGAGNENPWPSIDVLEDASTTRAKRRSP